MCCQEQHSQSSDCSVCSNHAETTHSPNLTPSQLFSPEVVGVISFHQPVFKINHIIFSPDRPPIV